VQNIKCTLKRERKRDINNG